MKNLFEDYNLSRFIVDPNLISREDLLEWIPQFKCPRCHRRLYWTLDGRIARCKSKKEDKFFITAETLDKFLK